jgi:hypothetical protein
VSFWHHPTRSLVVGDAFVTTPQESIYAAIIKKPEMHGPPMYFTSDWKSARQSVERLSGLTPELVITGHGEAMQGARMRRALMELADYFDEVATPQQ